jgi:rhomboid protease GluP
MIDAPLLSDEKRREARFASMFKLPTPISRWLFVSNIVLWVLAFVVGLFIKEGGGFSTSVLADLPPDVFVFYNGMKINSLVAAGEWWRLVSSMWVHLSFMHIAFNAYGLFIFAPFVERFYGGRRLMTIYMFSGLAGSIASFYFVDNPSGGASGALFGLIGAMLVFGFKHRKELPARVYRALTTGMLPWVVLNIGIGFFDAIPFDNGAHIGGLLGGAAATLLIRSRLRERTSKGAEMIFVLLMIAWGMLIVAVAILWFLQSISCLESVGSYVACYPDILN